MLKTLGSRAPFLLLSHLFDNDAVECPSPPKVQWHPNRAQAMRAWTRHQHETLDKQQRRGWAEKGLNGPSKCPRKKTTVKREMEEEGSVWGENTTGTGLITNGDKATQTMMPDIKATQTLMVQTRCLSIWSLAAWWIALVMNMKAPSSNQLPFLLMRHDKWSFFSHLRELLTLMTNDTW